MFFFLQRLGRSHLSWNHLWLCLFFLPEDTGRRSWSITLTCCTNTTTSRTLDSHFWVVSVRQWLQVTCLVWAWSGEGFGSGPTEKSESSDQMTKLWKHTEVPDDVCTTKPSSQSAIRRSDTVTHGLHIWDLQQTGWDISWQVLFISIIIFFKNLVWFGPWRLIAAFRAFISDPLSPSSGSEWTFTRQVGSGKVNLHRYLWAEHSKVTSNTRLHLRRHASVCPPPPQCAALKVTDIR